MENVKIRLKAHIRTQTLCHVMVSSLNLWEESGLKVDSAVTDVGWGARGTYISVYTIHEILYCDQRCG